MSDVREQLQQYINDADWETSELAGVILERFDVTPKPVVSDYDFGNWVLTAVAISGVNDPAFAGRELQRRIDAEGFEIVRCDDAS